MKISFKRLVSTIVIGQCLAIPITSVQLVAAPGDAIQNVQSTSVSGLGVGTSGQGAPTTSIQRAPYFTDSYGNILMNVNVWGNVVHGGPIAVPEGSDISTAISLAGGPVNGANLAKVRVNRATPDESGKMTYLVDLKTYAKEGNRSTLIELQPNDTVIVPENKALGALGILGIIAAGASIYSITR